MLFRPQHCHLPATLFFHDSRVHSWFFSPTGLPTNSKHYTKFWLSQLGKSTNWFLELDFFNTCSDFFVHMSSNCFIQRTDSDHNNRSHLSGNQSWVQVTCLNFGKLLCTKIMQVKLPKFIQFVSSTPHLTTCMNFGSSSYMVFWAE